MKQKRYLGLELAGAKNAKTTLAVLEYYPKERKIFALDVHTGIGPDQEMSSDEVLIQTLAEHAADHTEVKLGVNVPLTLPPAFLPLKRGQDFSDLAEVRWMDAHFSKRKLKHRDFFTPYTQRPVEIWLRNQVISRIPQKLRFEIDETMGGNKAPLTSRMHYLKHYLSGYDMHEVMPKLTVTLLMPFLKISQKTLLEHRKLEEGVQARAKILSRMSENLDIFIYERDQKKIIQNINAFDAFLCAYTVLLFDRNECVPSPRGFPAESGWVRYPKSPLLDSTINIDFVEDETEEENVDNENESIGGE